MELHEPDADLALEHGLFSTAQARRAGVTHAEITARVRRGRYVRVGRGILRDVKHELTADDALLLAFLRAGPQAVVGHRSAAALHGLDVQVPSQPEILVPNLPDQRRAGLARASVSESDVLVVGLLRVTTLERTVLDCAARLPEVEAVVMIDSAYRLGLATPRSLRQVWKDRAGTHGHAKAGRALDLADPCSGSAPETRFRLLVLSAGLAAPVSQYEVFDDGTFVGRADFAWPEFRLIVEIDGFEFHSGRAVFRTDRTRGNDLLDAEWNVLHFTPEDLDECPEDVLARVRRHLVAVAAR